MGDVDILIFMQSTTIKSGLHVLTSVYESIEAGFSWTQPEGQMVIHRLQEGCSTCYVYVSPILVADQMSDPHVFTEIRKIVPRDNKLAICCMQTSIEAHRIAYAFWDRLTKESKIEAYLHI